MVFMFFYVRLVYYSASFMAGYNKARSRAPSGGAAAAANKKKAE